MGITLIANICPKNDAFVGMVSGNQVIGSNLGGEVSVLPSSCISTNSLSEQYLRISNSPTDGYYLQYTDANDLIWSEVVGGSDVAWSGASEFYALSSNYNSHSGNTDIHFTVESILDEFYPSTLGFDLSSQFSTHINDSTIHYLTSDINMDDLADTSIEKVSGNSIVWNGEYWKDKNVSAESGPVSWGTISIDGDKDWSGYNNYNIGSVSSSTISGGTTITNSLTIGKGITIAQIQLGWDSVGDGGTIAHGCSTKPNWISVSPSGNTPIMYSCKVDETNITIYHSSPDSEVFSWFATV